MNEDCIEMIKLMEKDFVPEIEWEKSHVPDRKFYRKIFDRL